MALFVPESFNLECSMQSRNLIIQGDTLYSTTVPGFPEFDTSGSYRTPQFQENLNVPTAGNIHGDFTTPNNWVFTRDYTVSMLGSSLVHDWANNPPQDRIYNGVISTQVNRYKVNEFDGSVYQQALSKLAEKVRGELDLSIDAFQANQNVQMVKALGRLVSFVRSIKKSSLQDWYREFKRYKPGSPKAIGSKWLEFQYGVKPLAQDIWELSKTLAHRYPELMICEVKASQKFNGGETQAWTGDSDHPCVVRYNGADRCHLKIRMRPPETFKQLLGQYTSLNPFSIAWELLPYSFIVDWVLDVGGYMRALETELVYGSLFKDGFIVRTFLNEGSCAVHSRVDYGSNRYVIYNAEGSYRRVRYDRAVLSNYPIAVFPRFKANLGSGRLLNAAALLSQHLR